MSRRQHQLAVTSEQGMLERHFDTNTLLSSLDQQLGRSGLGRVHADCSRPFREQEGSGAAIGLLPSSGGDHVSGRLS
jgi:hypothetical protein